MIPSNLFPQDTHPYWNNIEVELREAKDSEKPGWVTWIVHNTVRFVTRTVNTIALFRYLGFFHEIFANIRKSSDMIAHFPTWKMNFHVTTNPKITEIFYKEHRNGKGLFSTHGSQKSTFVLLMEEVFPALNIQDEDMIFTCGEENSEKYRTFLHAKLTHSYLEKNTETMKEITKRTLDRFEAASQNGPLDVGLETKKFSAEIIGKLFLGYDGSYEEFTNAVDVLIKRLGIINFTRKVANKEEVDAAIATVTKVINDVSKQEGTETNIVTQMRSAGWTEAQVKGMVFMLFFAGQDTTANTLNYIQLKLAQDPKLQADVASGAVPIDWLIVEGMRMMPAAGFVARIAKEDLVLTVTNLDNNQKFDHYIPKGDRVATSAAFASRDPQTVTAGDDLENFNPYRWKDQEIPKYLLNLSWGPLGGGTHSCPGHKVAQNEMRIFLTELLNRFTLSTEIEGEPRQKTVFTARVDGAIPITFTKK